MCEARATRVDDHTGAVRQADDVVVEAGHALLSIELTDRLDAELLELLRDAKYVRLAQGVTDKVNLTDCEHPGIGLVEWSPKRQEASAREHSGGVSIWCWEVPEHISFQVGRHGGD